MLRIGQGIDVHAFGPGDHVVLGGISIPHTHGLVAHSDGDVLLHALSDALLGALALGDIGQHFPDTDPRYRGADSGQLLQQVYRLVREKNYQLVNTDITVMCERPRLAPFNQVIRENIARLLETGPDRVGLKATTSEQLGFTGRREGILVTAVVLLTRSG